MSWDELANEKEDEGSAYTRVTAWNSTTVWPRPSHKPPQRCSIPTPRPIISSVQRILVYRNTSSLVNTSEHRTDVDGVLKDELSALHTGLDQFYFFLFGGVESLELASKAAFTKCTERRGCATSGTQSLLQPQGIVQSRGPSCTLL